MRCLFWLILRQDAVREPTSNLLMSVCSDLWFVYKWTFSEIDSTASIHVKTDRRMVFSLINVNKLVFLFLSVFVKFYITSIANF